MNDKTVVILGIRGRLGRTAAREFAAAGYHVIGLSRDGQVPPEIANISTRPADARNRQSLIEACRGADFLFNGLNPKYTDWERDCMPIAENVIAAAREHDAIHLFPGNVYVFGEESPTDLSEQTDFCPTTRKGRIRCEMETRFRKAAQQGVRTITLRAGDFFGGPGTGSWFDLVIASKALTGTTRWPGKKDIPHEWAYLPDFAAAFAAIAEKADQLPAYEVFHFPGHAVTGEQMLEAISKALDSPQRFGPFPWQILRWGGFLMPMWTEISEMRYLWDKPHRLVSDRIADVIGTVPHTDFDEAVSRALSDIGVRSRLRQSSSGHGASAASQRVSA